MNPPESEVVPRRCASCGGVMRLSVLSNLIGSVSRALKDQSYRFACTTCGHRIVLMSDYGLIVNAIVATAAIIAAVASLLGHSGVKWNLLWGSAAFIMGASFITELVRRSRNPKLPRTVTIA